LTLSASTRYIAPFAVFIGFLGLHSVWPLPARIDEPLRLAVMVLVIGLVAWPVLDFRVVNWAGSTALGIAIFAIWILPDLLFPGYRHSIVFQNPVMGKIASSLKPEALADPLVLGLRGLRAVLIVPIVEELFWRGWMMRWLINPEFEKVPLGTYAPAAFWTVALLFASEHGPYWDVGLAAGILFNLWMIRTRSLGDLILSHAVANLSLSAYVIAAGKWEYWL
jgi:CAAX prenyl protease-like protein